MCISAVMNGSRFQLQASSICFAVVSWLFRSCWIVPDNSHGVQTFLRSTHFSNTAIKEGQLNFVFLLLLERTHSFSARTRGLFANSWPYLSHAQVDIDGLTVTAEYQAIQPTLDSDMSPPRITAVGGYYTKIAVRLFVFVTEALGQIWLHSI